MSTEIEDENICCHRCAEGKIIRGIPVAFTRLIVCRKCGNKRCPHASDHDQPCTGSNEPGQAGSISPQTSYVTLPENLNGLADAAFNMVDRGEDPSDVLRMIEHGLRKANKVDA